MAKIENQFFGMEDSAMKKTLDEYERWRDSGVIPAGGLLAEARDKYCEAYDAHGLVIMERDLLYAGTKRWLDMKTLGQMF